MCRIRQLAARRQSIEFGRFDRLHDDGRRLIQGWYDRAVADDQRAEPDFASYIYLWIAFNGWAACVTGEDTDRVWIDALIAEPDLNDRFNELMSEQSTATATAARQFAELWPIFRVSELRARGIDHWAAYESRVEMTKAYLDAGARTFEPQCFLEHPDVPLDWGHTLLALYRVRCNLFHGEKARSSEGDRMVVSCAHATLLAFLKATDVLGARRLEARAAHRT